MARNKTRNSTLSSVVLELRKKSLSLLVMPHTGFFARHGLDLLDDKVDPQIWKMRIQNVLLHPSEPTPHALVEALTEVQAMATPLAHEEFLKLAQEHGIDLGSDAALLTDVDLAAVFYARHNDLFMKTFVRLETRSPERFDDFFDMTRAPLHERINETTMEQFTRSVREWWSVSRKRPAFSEVLIEENELTLAMLIAHGDVARCSGTIHPTTFERTRVTFIPECHDTIIFDKRTGRLSIHTQHKKDIKHYQTLVGEVFFQDHKHYKEHRTYTTAPLIEDGPKALEGDAEIELSSAYVKEMHLSAADPKLQLQMVIRAPKTSELLTKSLESAMTLGLDTVTYLKLGLKFATRKKEYVVELRPPITLSVAQDVSDEVHQWLRARGFLIPPSTVSVQ
jgi:hypothetical protein